MSEELSISEKLIENQIFTVRKVQVMLDFHLAALYKVETKRINEQVKRNAKRFPKSFMFSLLKMNGKICSRRLRLQKPGPICSRRLRPQIAEQFRMYIQNKALQCYRQCLTAILQYG